MDRTMIADLKSGERVNQLFLVREKALRTAKNGSFYMQIDFSDRTGNLSARMWDASQGLFESFQPDDFVRARGRVETYQGRLQLVVDEVEKRPASEADIADFLPATTKDVDAMFDRIVEIAKTVRHPGLRKLLAAFLKDPDVAAKFRPPPSNTTTRSSAACSNTRSVSPNSPSPSPNDTPTSTATCSLPASSCTTSARSTSSPTTGASATPTPADSSATSISAPG